MPRYYNETGEQTKVKRHYYLLTTQEDGVYLNVMEAEVEGMEMTEADLLDMLKKADFDDLDHLAVREACETGIGASKRIAPPQEINHAPDTFTVKVAPDKLSASMVITKGDERGAHLTIDQVLSSLENDYKIVYGIKKDVIEELIRDNEYNIDTVIAEGTAPKEGVDGTVSYHFETSHNKIGQEVDGRIDFKHLDLFANVHQGDVLATKTDAVPGIEGTDVYGGAIKVKEPKEAKFFYGKNVVVSSDGKSLVATIDGKADLEGNKVSVAQVYTVNGDVDLSVGNIDFVGDIVVTGNVMEGFEVKAGGNVEVYGFVEGAQIIAEKDIIVRGNFFGNARGMLNAKGNVICKSVESGVINAGVSIVAEVALYSNLYCPGVIKICNENSNVIGGNICSGSKIILKNAGSISGTTTNLRIELPSGTNERIQQLDQMREKLDLLDKQLNEKKEAALASDNIDMDEKVKLMNNILAVQKSIEQNEREKNDLKALIDNVQNGAIVIRGRAHYGVDLYMGKLLRHVDDTVDYTKFVLKGGEITAVPI
ncbi:MAG: DUF342 domain-containing protein [Clostridia bacterium]|nr:DUF342 domain-containing protein [Clostridia bacterium]